MKKGMFVFLDFQVESKRNVIKQLTIHIITFPGRNDHLAMIKSKL
jgi:hypothetical protein